MSGWRWFAALGWLVLGAGVAAAGGPRFVTGSQYSGIPAGKIMAFYTPTPMYFTDSGDLSKTVSHAQADAMVAAAAGVWNVPYAAVTLAQGGVLDEHVTALNSYFDGVGVVFPADVQASNYLAKPIAVLYDSDGSLIDLLLGSGASEPSGCRQNAVIESVDGFGQTGTIQHAVIVLNGRCVGSAPEQMLQMQYQLERVFGRVLGLAWSQCNDNVFTAATPVTGVQAQYWPVMHPIDVICGPYTYQCMQEPFRLRPDDISALALVYPVTTANLTVGKVLSVTNALSVHSKFLFATGQGMEGTNFYVRWGQATLPFEPYALVSGMSGALFQRDGGNPVTGLVVGTAANFGSKSNDAEAGLAIGRIPLDYTSGRVNQLAIVSEPINPLYSGEYAIGPYKGPPVATSGTSAVMYGWIPNGGFDWNFQLAADGAPTSCNPGADGVERAPVAADASGWWTGLLCSLGHVSWVSASVKAGRSWTLEVTALDEAGAASGEKAQPVMGVWNAEDATGSLPTVAATSSAMNSRSVGMTQLVVGAASAMAVKRIVIADQMGRGRPDFSYRARLLYADTVTPSVVSAEGGRIVISGMGFRQGNVVMVNGVKAMAVSWTSTQIVATAPSLNVAGALAGTLVDVAVVDVGTAGSTVMSGVLQYAAPVKAVTMAAGTKYVAAGEVVQWSASVTATNGGAAVGVPVEWSSTAGIGLGSLQGVTDASGAASVVATANGLGGGSQGTVTGCAWGTVCASELVNAVDASLWTVAVQSGGGQAVGLGGTLGSVVLVVTDGAGHAVQGAPVSVYQRVEAWEAACPVRGRCPVAAVLGTGKTAGVSDENGLVVAIPLHVAGAAQVVKIAAVTGMSGFVAATLAVEPW